jgi:hypothetical protein
MIKIDLLDKIKINTCNGLIKLHLYKNNIFLKFNK